MSEYEVTNAYISGALIFTAQGHDTPVVLPGSGILTRSIFSPSEIILSSGSVLKGINLTFDNGDPVELDSDQRLMVMIRAEDAGGAVIVHEDVGVPADQRMTTWPGNNITVGPDKIQCWYECTTAGLWRWRVPDWTYYGPGAPADWDVAPVSRSAALDRIAAEVAILKGSPIT